MRRLPHAASHVMHRSLPQSISHLPEQYGLTLNPQLASVDPLYALSELLFFSVSSEAQFLNLIEERVSECMDNYKGEETLTLNDLNYSRRLLRRHIQYVEDICTFLEGDIGRHWPLPPDRPDQACQIQALLVEDFKHLACRGHDLVTQTLEGMNFISNGVMLEESRSAIAKADGMHRLTLLAFFFIPLSFTTSLFGANFKEFGTGILSIWVLAATLVPATALATIMCFWDSISKMKFIRKRSTK
jgi:Mg2+ and Co2+ transporter CorA